MLTGQELLHTLQIAAPAPNQAASFPRDTGPHSRQSYLHMFACVEPSVERFVRVNIPLRLCRWNGCVCVCSSVCSLVCLSVVVVEPHHHRSACSSPPSQHTATETLPEIFNSVAAVNRAATLESMSHG